MSVLTTLAFLLSLSASQVAAKCQSYGADYMDGGRYLLQGNVDANFTADETFTGCQSDIAHNILVDPNGDESECTQTNLQPDGVIQNFDCPQWKYKDMYDGEWSIIVISNNGNGDPIDYQRDFYLSFVGGTATNPSATSTLAAKREVPTTLQTAYRAPAWETPSAFPSDTGYHGAPSAFPTNTGYAGAQPSAFEAWKGGETPSAYQATATAEPSAFVPWKGGATPTGYSQPGETQKPDHEAGDCTEQFVKAVMAGSKPDDDLKRRFVQERRQKLGASS